MAICCSLRRASGLQITAQAYVPENVRLVNLLVTVVDEINV